MHTFPSQISRNLKEKLSQKNPDLLLYIDNPYIEELVNVLIDIISEELADLKNKSISKDDFRRF